MRRTRNIAAALTLLVAFGLLRQPWESSLTGRLTRGELTVAPIEGDDRRDLGQFAYAMALGGFRSILATILSLEATAAWAEVDWDRLHRLYQNITRLEPGNIAYWNLAQWHLGYNAFAWYRDDPGIREEIVRRRRMDLVLDRAEQYLREGLRYHPDNYRLYEQMAMLAKYKRNDPAAAALWFGRAADREGAPGFLRRFQGYALAEVPGRDEEAYDLLRRLWNEGPVHRKPTMVAKLRALEATLGIPPERSVFRRYGDPASEPASPGDSGA